MGNPLDKNKILISDEKDFNEMKKANENMVEGKTYEYDLDRLTMCQKIGTSKRNKKVGK